MNPNKPEKRIKARIAAALVTGLCAFFAAPAFSQTRDSTLSIDWIDGNSRLISETKGHLTYSPSLVPEPPPARDPSRFRITVSGAPVHPSVRLSLLSVDPQTHKVRQRLDIPLRGRSDKSGNLVTPWLVVVNDWSDLLVPNRRQRAIYARPRDNIVAELRLGGSTPIFSARSIGLIGTDHSKSSILTLRIRITVLKTSKDGHPVVGESNIQTRAIVQHQIEILRDVLAQCSIDVEINPEDLQIASPPEACLITVGDRHGLLTKGGLVRLTVDGTPYGPFEMPPNSTPSQTAQLLVKRLEDNGYRAQLTVNAKPATFAHPSADIVVRREDGHLARIDPWPGKPLFTDRQQTIEIGSVHPAFGIDSYDENNFPSGTLEERTLVKCLIDSAEPVINVFIVGELADPTRQGESFIRHSTPPMARTVLVDTRALVGARQSYTVSHEIGHVLLNDLDHPDARGDDRPFLLMHSRSSSALGGPRHLTDDECAKMRAVSKDILF